MYIVVRAKNRQEKMLCRKAGEANSVGREKARKAFPRKRCSGGDLEGETLPSREEWRAGNSTQKEQQQGSPEAGRLLTDPED